MDRLEFKETTEALRFLATCQMGWYWNRGGRYHRKNLLNVLGDGFTRCGLPKDHGIAVRVAKDGQAWYAWRRTVTGWCFAIGAAGPRLTSGSSTALKRQTGSPVRYLSGVVDRFRRGQS